MWRWCVKGREGLKKKEESQGGNWRRNRERERERQKREGSWFDFHCNYYGVINQRRQPTLKNATNSTNERTNEYTKLQPPPPGLFFLETKIIMRYYAPYEEIYLRT